MKIGDRVKVKGGTCAGWLGTVVDVKNNFVDIDCGTCSATVHAGQLELVDDTRDVPPSIDLKPRSVKTQAWLLPLDVLARLGDVPESFANYQRIVQNDDQDIQIVRELVFDCLGCSSYIEAAEVFAHGAAKYAPDNWRSFPWDSDSRREYLSALLRHWLAGPDEIDRDSGLRHRAHCLCNALMILSREMEACGVDSDNG